MTTRLLSRAALLACAAALIPAASASAADCLDCEPGPGTGGSGTSYPTPQTTITSGPGALTWDNTPSFSYKSDLANVRYRCRITTGATTGSAFDCGQTTYAGVSVSYALAPQADGAHTLSVSACKDYSSSESTVTRCDASAATYAFTVDTARPDLAVSGTSATVHSRTSPEFTFSSTSSDFRYFRCGIDGASSWVECGPTFSWPADAAEGEHTVHLHSYDWAGNLSSNMEVRRWVKDTVKPVVAIGGAQGTTTNRRPAFTYTTQDADPQLTVECVLSRYGGNADLVPCSGGSFKPAADLADGEWTLSVRAEDRAGNAGEPQQRKVVIDTVAPALSEITWNPETKRLTYTADDGPLACRFDNGSEFACGTNVDASQLDDGEHTFVVTLKDDAGNATTKTKAFRIGAPPATGGDGGQTGGDEQPGGGSTPPTGGGDTPREEGPAPVVDERQADGPAPIVVTPPANQPVKPAAKPAAKKKRCRTVTKRVRGKKRKVRVCTKKKAAKRVARRG